MARGSPVFPSFFEALTRSQEKPLAIVTIGGISSVTWIGPVGELVAFDVGAGNIILDTWMRMRLGAEMDFDGIWAAKGHVEEKIIGAFDAPSVFGATAAQNIGSE